MSREQRLEAALQEAQQCLYRDGANAAGEVKAIIAAALGEQEAAEVLALSDDDLERRWTEGTPATVTLSTWHAGEQEATPPEPDVCPRCGCTKREMYREGCRRQDGPPHSWHRESVVEAESGDVERWPGTTERPWFVEGLTAMDRFRSRVILYVGDSDQDRADLAMVVEAVNAYAASAPQGEPEPPCEDCGGSGVFRFTTGRDGAAMQGSCSTCRGTGRAAPQCRATDTEGVE